MERGGSGQEPRVLEGGHEGHSSHAESGGGSLLGVFRDGEGDSVAGAE